MLEETQIGEAGLAKRPAAELDVVDPWSMQVLLVALADNPEPVGTKSDLGSDRQ